MEILALNELEKMADELASQFGDKLDNSPCIIPATRGSTMFCKSALVVDGSKYSKTEIDTMRDQIISDENYLPEMKYIPIVANAGLPKIYVVDRKIYNENAKNEIHSQICKNFIENVKSDNLANRANGSFVNFYNTIDRNLSVLYSNTDENTNVCSVPNSNNNMVAKMPDENNANGPLLTPNRQVDICPNVEVVWVPDYVKTKVETYVKNQGKAFVPTYNNKYLVFDKNIEGFCYNHISFFTSQNLDTGKYAAINSNLDTMLKAYKIDSTYGEIPATKKAEFCFVARFSKTEPFVSTSYSGYSPVCKKINDLVKDGYYKPGLYAVYWYGSLTNPDFYLQKFDESK